MSIANKNELISLNISRNLLLAPETAKFISGLFSLESESEKTKICFAIEDILEYRIKNLKNDEQHIHLSVTEEPKHYKVSVFDKGLPYAILGTRKQIFDNGMVEYYEMKQMGSAGQELSMYFKYAEGSQKILKPEIDNDEKLKGDNFSCRLLEPTEKDMIEAIRCLYSAYGFDYFHQDLYAFDSFSKKLRGGTYWTVICENEFGQMVGHCALDSSGLLQGMPEFCCLVTKPCARGYGVASMMLEFAENIAIENNFEGIFINPVTYHPFTQKITNREKYFPVAMCPSIAGPEARGLPYQMGDVRASEVISAKILNKKKHVIYPPAEYADFVCKTIDGLDLDLEIGVAENNSLSESSNFQYSNNTHAKVAWIGINEAGNDIIDCIKALMNDELWNDVEMIALYINIGNPSCLEFYDGFRDLGYTFSGLIPGCVAGDYILMQWFRTPYPLDTMVLEPNYAEMVGEFISINDQLNK